MIQHNLIKCIEFKIDQKQSELSETLQEMLNEFILPKRLENQLYINIIELKKNKRSSTS